MLKHINLSIFVEKLRETSLTIKNGVMKKILLLLTAIIISLAAVYSQSLTLSDVDGNTIENGSTIVFGGTTGEIIEGHIHITNTTGNDMDITVTKVEEELVDGSNNTFCVGINCYPPSTYVSNSFTIEAGDTNDSFYGEYSANGNEGNSTITYIFKPTASPNDSVFATAEYQAPPEGINEMFLDKNLLSKAYPNPSNNYAKIDYSFDNEPRNFQVVFFNVLGKEIYKEQVINRSGTLEINTQDWHNGIYYYMLLAGNEKFSAKKMIVKH